MAIRLTLSLSLMLVILSDSPHAFADEGQPSWKMTPRPSAHEQVMNAIRRDPAQVEAEKKRQQLEQERQKSVHKSLLQNPNLKGSTDPWKNFSDAVKNAFGQKDTTSNMMKDYSGNQRYSRDVGTYTDGGQRFTGQYDGTGSMGQDSGAAPSYRGNQLPDNLYIPK